MNTVSKIAAHWRKIIPDPENPLIPWGQWTKRGGGDDIIISCGSAV